MSDITVANGYFVRNDVNVNGVPERIDNSYVFDRFFGSAAVMGPDGMPTKIDFTKSSVIPIVLPSTDMETEIEVLDTTLNHGVMKVRYKVIEGQKQSYSITPMIILIANKLPKDTKVELIKE